MKYFIFLFVVLIAISPTFPQWQIQNIGTSEDLNDVAIINQTSAVVVGNNGTILKTTNNGVEWISKNSGTTNNLNAVSFWDDQNGIAVGNEIICRTTDSGENWTDIAFTENFITVSYRESFWGGPNILIGSENGLILYSGNDGNTWEDSLLFLSESIIAVGFNYTSPVLHSPKTYASTTSYTGISLFPPSSWYIFGNPVNPVWDILTGGEFYDGSQYLVGWSGNPGPVPLLLKRIDFDTTWNTTYSFVPPPFIPEDITSIGELVYVCGSAGKIFNSTDGGDHWSEQYTNTSETLEAIAFWGNLIGYSVGENGTILYTSNGGVSSIEYGLPIISDFKLEQNYPNPFNSSTIIIFTIPQSPLPGGDGRGGFVTLKVYDILGIELATLVNEKLRTGEYQVNYNSHGLTSGIYFYELRISDFVQRKKMVIIK